MCDRRLAGHGCVPAAPNLPRDTEHLSSALDIGTRPASLVSDTCPAPCTLLASWCCRTCVQHLRKQAQGVQYPISHGSYGHSAPEVYYHRHPHTICPSARVPHGGYTAYLQKPCSTQHISKGGKVAQSPVRIGMPWATLVTSHRIPLLWGF